MLCSRAAHGLLCVGTLPHYAQPLSLTVARGSLQCCLPRSSSVRKGYHLLAVALFLPALLMERQLLGVALAAAFALLLAVEAARLSGVPGIGESTVVLGLLLWRVWLFDLHW